jgi:hypothetical protein
VELSVLWLITVNLLVAASIGNSVAVIRLRVEVAELRATQNKPQEKQQ